MGRTGAPAAVGRLDDPAELAQKPVAMWVQPPFVAHAVGGLIALALSAGCCCCATPARRKKSVGLSGGPGGRASVRSWPDGRMVGRLGGWGSRTAGRPDGRAVGRSDGRSVNWTGSRGWMKLSGGVASGDWAAVEWSRGPSSNGVPSLNFGAEFVAVGSCISGWGKSTVCRDVVHVVHLPYSGRAGLGARPHPRCGHRFCKECAALWLERSDTCPTCRHVARPGRRQLRQVAGARVVKHPALTGDWECCGGGWVQAAVVDAGGRAWPWDGPFVLQGAVLCCVSVHNRRHEVVRRCGCACRQGSADGPRWAPSRLVSGPIVDPRLVLGHCPRPRAPPHPLERPVRMP